jgi:hypothetical protein
MDPRALKIFRRKFKCRHISDKCRQYRANILFYKSGLENRMPQTNGTSFAEIINMRKVSGTTKGFAYPFVVCDIIPRFKPAIEAYPVVQGCPIRVRAAANRKRRWDWSFAKSLNHPAAYRSQELEKGRGEARQSARNPLRQARG